MSQWGFVLLVLQTTAFRWDLSQASIPCLSLESDARFQMISGQLQSLVLELENAEISDAALESFLLNLPMLEMLSWKNKLQTNMKIPKSVFKADHRCKCFRDLAEAAYDVMILTWFDMIGSLYLLFWYDDNISYTHIFLMLIHIQRL